MGKISQRELDLESFEQGRKRYYRNVRRAMTKGCESETNWGTRMTESAILPFSTKLEEVLKTDTGVGAVLLNALGMDVETIAMIAFRSLLDGCSKNNKTFTRSCIEAAKVIQSEAIAKAMHGKDPERMKRFKSWVQARGGQRQAKDIKRIASYVYPDIIEEFGWSDEEALKVGYVLAMTACQSTGLFERITFKRNARTAVSMLVMTKEAWEYAHKAMRHGETLRPVKLPMVVPPRKWNSPEDGGYEAGFGDPLVKGASKVAKATHTKEAMPQVYDAINTIQHTPFRVNQKVMEVALALMESRSPLGDLDVHDEKPMPPKPPEASMDNLTPEQTLIRRRYYMDCTRIADFNRKVSSRRLGVIQTLNLAVKFASEQDLRFFQAAALDFRGRFYCQATGLSHQGNDLQRGLVEFGMGHPVPARSEAMNAWLRHGSAVFGKKGTLEERAAFMAGMIRSGEIDAIAKAPLDTVHLWGKADEPFSFLAWCLDMPGVRAGKPSHLMVAVDGSCNGLQVLSLLLRDEVGAAAVNVLPASKPSDIYQLVADRTMERIAEARLLGEEYADGWLSLGVSRSMVKRPVMCLPYSISQRSAMLYLKESYFEFHRDGPWADPSKPCGFLIRKVWPSIKEIVLKGGEFLEWAKVAGKVIVNANILPMWVTPDGFTVQQNYWSYMPSRVKTTLGKEAHIWQIRNKTAKIDRRKHVSGLVPNLVHSLDATAARMTARRLAAAKVPDMAFVHDSYLVHAAFHPVLAKELREAWVETFSGDPLADWVRQINAQLPTGVSLPPPPTYGNLDVSVIRDSKYFFA
jgi:DNA-directed RNA polymerase